MQLTDKEMAVLLTLAGPIEQSRRSEFLLEVETELQAQAGEIGEGAVHRIGRQVQKRLPSIRRSSAKASRRAALDCVAVLATCWPMADTAQDLTLYDADVLLWAEQQGALLRRRAFDELDLDNVIEEIESVGREQLHAVESFLVQALVHDLKARAWPSSREVPTWRGEARRFRGDAADRVTPAMRQRIDIEKIYRRALRALPETIDGVEPLPLPASCPTTLAEMLAG